MIRKDGTLHSWNEAGCCSDVPQGSDFVAVDSGAGHSVALRIDGSLASWGSETTDWSPPSGSDFVEVAAGHQHALAIRLDGSLVSWGNDSSGSVSQTPAGNDFVAIAAGEHSIALRSDGTVVAWGRDNTNQVSDTPAEGGFIDVDAGRQHSLAIKADGTIVAWGGGEFGVSPQSGKPSDAGYAVISGGGQFSMALKAEPKQLDFDDDGQGDACDTDDDNDGFTDAQEAEAGTDPLDAASFPHGATGQPLVFSSDRSGDWEIYLTDGDGTSVVQLTVSPGRDQEPALSPDGSKVAFHSERDGNWEIYVVDIDGSNLTRLTNNSVDDYSPKFSPDGNRIIFDSFRSGNMDICVMNADGSSEVNLTEGTIMASRPEWSLDGTRIAFSSGSYSTHEIVVMDADGTNRVFLTDNDYVDYAPAWSPDGSKLLYFSEQAGNREIHVMDVDGSNVVNLTNHPSDDYEPAWSSDGSQIVFQSDRDGDNALFVMNADGSGQVKLIDSVSGEDTQPHWLVSPINLEDGLVAHYPFNGNADDASGNDNHGLLYGGPTLAPDRFGNPDSAYSFDGSNDYIKSSGTFAPQSEGVISLWFKADQDTVAGSGIASSRSDYGYLDGDWLIEMVPSLWVYYWNGGEGWNGPGGIPLPSLEQWHHLVLNWDVATGSTTYLDGNVVGSSPVPVPIFGDLPIEIGRNRHQLIHYYEGLIDDVRIYNRALSAEEVAALYASEPPVESCQGWLEAGETESGLYTIHPDGGAGIEVYCDMTTQGGGWTKVIYYPSDMESRPCAAGSENGTLTANRYQAGEGRYCQAAEYHRGDLGRRLGDACGRGQPRSRGDLR